MSVVAIIQARMGSTRLPGKVLKDIGGRTMLARVFSRVKQSARLDNVIVATTNSLADDVILAECQRYGLPCYRGSEDDVLDRYFRAAHAYKAEVVVRITADCPLSEPEVIDRVVSLFLREQPDYASNTLERSYPIGLDVEVINIDALEQAWREAVEAYHRSHVTSYIYQNPDLFRLLSTKAEFNNSIYRWTVDTSEDLDFVRIVYARLGNGDDITWHDVLDLLKKEPYLADLNRHILQKSLEEG
jgi:spore coat polysaccharide biosynthesis protein SpsF